MSSGGLPLWVGVTSVAILLLGQIGVAVWLLRRAGSEQGQRMAAKAAPVL
jgi:hypothetical protein